MDKSVIKSTLSKGLVEIFSASFINKIIQFGQLFISNNYFCFRLWKFFLCTKYNEYGITIRRIRDNYRNIAVL